MTKDELRQRLQAHVEDYQGEVLLYAAEPLPERKPWKKRPTPLDEAYQRALAEAGAQNGEKH